MVTEYRVHHGGLMRCCLASLDEKAELNELPESAMAVARCRYCKNPMRLEDGVWRWFKAQAEADGASAVRENDAQ